MIYKTEIKVTNVGEYPDKNLFIECSYSSENKYPLSVWIKNPYIINDNPKRFYYQLKNRFETTLCYTLLSAHLTLMDNGFISINTKDDLLAAFCPPIHGVSAVSEYDIEDGVV